MRKNVRQRRAVKLEGRAGRTHANFSGAGTNPGYFRILPDASGCVRMRRDFEFQQISANSGKIPAKFGQNLAKFDKNWQEIEKNSAVFKTKN